MTQSSDAKVKILELVQDRETCEVRDVFRERVEAVAALYRSSGSPILGMTVWEDPDGRGLRCWLMVGG